MPWTSQGPQPDGVPVTPLKPHSTGPGPRPALGLHPSCPEDPNPPGPSCPGRAATPGLSLASQGTTYQRTSPSWWPLGWAAPPAPFSPSASRPGWGPCRGRTSTDTAPALPPCSCRTSPQCLGQQGQRLALSVPWPSPRNPGRKGPSCGLALSQAALPTLSPASPLQGCPHSEG